MKKANESETKKVLEAISNGDSIPNGFAYAPHDKQGPVLKLEEKDDAALQSQATEKKA